MCGGWGCFDICSEKEKQVGVRVTGQGFMTVIGAYLLFFFHGVFFRCGNYDGRINLSIFSF